ncbi:ACT domain protein [Rubripirellula lacrimiformis]|uniref:ACT domain protein n=1 Tax=Rubripirellula lacrimiformis TaxID=1930273 RepID=A0A517N9N3_9BACT|nr:ACT domain-containing protein [Rubripirellula lacrimiformis]QDT03846.1 ACT domain protein [Rubripirellula lacrimiformis]
MAGSTDLRKLIASLSPTLRSGEYVFVTLPNASYGDGAELQPIAAFAESEGLTLVISKNSADHAGHSYEGSFRLVTLQVHSDLNAVGLTAAVADALSKRGISANVVAAYFHDHVFVPSSRADEALQTLRELMLSDGAVDG